MAISTLSQLRLVCEEKPHSEEWYAARRPYLDAVDKLRNIVQTVWPAKGPEIWQAMDKHVQMDIVRCIMRSSVSASVVDIDIKSGKVSVNVELEIWDEPSNDDDTEVRGREFVDLMGPVWHDFVQMYVSRAIGVLFGDVPEISDYQAHGDGVYGTRYSSLVTFNC